MAADLGTWPPEQATVVLEALQEAGLKPDARRTREGVHVTVGDDEADRANQTLVANMDRIAQAARSPGRAERAARRPRSTPRREPRSRPRRDQPSASLGSERVQRFAKPLGVLLVGLLLASVAPQLALPIVIATVAGVVYLLGRQAQSEED